jgi:hypothetical protein
VHGDLWISSMVLHASWLTVTSSYSEWKYRPKCQKFDPDNGLLKKIQKMVHFKTRSVNSPNMQCTLSRSMQFVHKAHNVTARLYSIIFFRAGRPLVCLRGARMSTRSQLSKKPSQLQWNGIWCAWICSRIRNKYFVWLVLCCTGMGPRLVRLQYPILVLLHNKAAEGLAKSDCLGYDIHSGIADTKALFLKFCRPFEKRIRSMVPTHQVVPAGPEPKMEKMRQASSFRDSLLMQNQKKRHSLLWKLKCISLRATRIYTWSGIGISARINMPTVAEWSRRTYPAPLGQGSDPA